MEKENVFKRKHYQPDMILLTVRWYLRDNLSFRDSDPASIKATSHCSAIAPHCQ